jgi:HSP20 family molecular chaperone IbpA
VNALQDWLRASVDEIFRSLGKFCGPERRAWPEASPVSHSSSAGRRHSASRTWTPGVDVIEKDDMLTIPVDLPGRAQSTASKAHQVQIDDAGGDRKAKTAVA